MRVLLVEDDEMIGRTLARSLRDDSFSVDWVKDGLTATTALSAVTTPYTLVLLDWSLPHQSGIEVLKGMRKNGVDTPVLMLTARDSVHDRVQGLDAGADDYLVKPFSLLELRARIRSLLRRRSVRPDSVLACGQLRLDFATRKVEYEGRPIETTAREFALLNALLDTPGAVLSRQQLEARIYEWDTEITSNAVEFLIHGLRRKLAPDVIENVRGVGWRIKGAP